MGIFSNSINDPAPKGEGGAKEERRVSDPEFCNEFWTSRPEFVTFSLTRGIKGSHDRESQYTLTSRGSAKLLYIFKLRERKSNTLYLTEKKIKKKIYKKTGAIHILVKLRA